MKTVVFIGDAPARGCEKDEAFSPRSASGRKLRGWIAAAGFYQLCASTNEPIWRVRFVNQSEGRDLLDAAIYASDLAVAVGFRAWNALQEYENRVRETKGLRIPHPSGKNRQLNDPGVEEKIIEILNEVREKIDGIVILNAEKF